ncbi:sigma 54 modulation/S30EA ribosomal C-terminal domain-containing protein [Kribbella sp. NBC_00482]|uniref:sigma 54 modulation/S30EA ribosomal C-terminal domain-containing protein n=1 Tax=Kribbella sp. NBC_00482 TaxID=2975968 RepID=UPI002E171C81
MSTEGQVVLPLRSVATVPVSTTGIVPTDAATVIHEHLAPILGPWTAYTRVRLTRLAEPGLRRPLVAQIDVQLSAGHRVRAQTAAATMTELVTVLAMRTIEQLRVYPRALAACLRGHVVTDLLPSPPELLPPERRRLARRKICRPAPMTVAEAIVVLNAMDYRLHLFREKFSRQDSIVVRSGLGRYRVIQSRPNPIGLEVTSPPMALAAAERRSVTEATGRLDLTGAPFDIFTDHATGRLHALYARYDGHYGLLGAEAATRSARRSW